MAPSVYYSTPTRPHDCHLTDVVLALLAPQHAAPFAAAWLQPALLLVAAAAPVHEQVAGRSGERARQAFPGADVLQLLGREHAPCLLGPRRVPRGARLHLHTARSARDRAHSARVSQLAIGCEAPRLVSAAVVARVRCKPAARPTPQRVEALLTQERGAVAGLKRGRSASPAPRSNRRWHGRDRFRKRADSAP